MNFKNLILTTATVAIAPVFSHAAVVDAGSYATEASGSTAFVTQFNAPRTQFFDSQAAGTLETFTVWFNLASSVFGSGENIVFSLLGLETDGPEFFFGPDQELASESFAEADVASGPQIVGNLQIPFVKFTWDLSGFGIEADVGERFGVRIFPDGDGALGVSTNSCTFASPLCPQPEELDLTLFTGSQTAIGTGTGSFSFGYALTVDDGTPVDPDGGSVSPVPVPAGLPLLLAGLGALGWVRRKV